VPLSTFLLAFVGALTLMTYASSLVRFLFAISLGKGVPLYRFKASKGTTYAIVTGCTSGIGLEFARQLAADGFGLILVGRRQSALDELARELEGAHKIRALSVVADAADPKDLHAAVERIAAVARTVDTGILINNVGASHEMPVAFHETDPAEIDNIVQTNISWTLQLTRAVMPLLVARSTPGYAPKSLVMTIGSLSGRIPSPLLAAYSCTKGGLKTWNTALAAEVQSKGVVCTMVFPAFVVSNMSKIRKPSLTVPTPAKFVKSTLGSIGAARGAQGRLYESTPYPAHAVMDYAVGLAGNASENIAVSIIHSMHKDIRKRALKKKERQLAAKTE
jgi:17beta-estradiol 17-dehydrogenase / very-long-chain 3-oxoacyl-CoA reductase